MIVMSLAYVVICTFFGGRGMLNNIGDRTSLCGTLFFFFIFIFILLTRRKATEALYIG